MVVQNMDPDKAAELLLMGNAEPVNVCPPKVLHGRFHWDAGGLMAVYSTLSRCRS